MRRASALPLGGRDDLFDPEVYRASTADLSDFLRDTGPDDTRGGPRVGKGGPAKDVDRDGMCLRCRIVCDTLFTITLLRRC